MSCAGLRLDEEVMLEVVLKLMVATAAGRKLSLYVECSCVLRQDATLQCSAKAPNM